MISAPIGTDTASLLRVNCPSAPLLLTTNEPGPVGGALGPLAGRVKLTEVRLSPASAGVEEERTHLAARAGAEQIDRHAVDGVEAGAAQLHHAALHHDGFDVVGGEVGVDAGGGQARAVDRQKRRDAGGGGTLQQRVGQVGCDEGLASVLTTCTATNPCPSGLVAGTLTVSWVAVSADGVSGPALTGPPDVATKKFTTEPGVKPLPLILKAPPTSMTPGSAPINGWPATAVAVGVGVAVLVADGVPVGVRVGVCVGV